MARRFSERSSTIGIRKPTVTGPDTTATNKTGKLKKRTELEPLSFENLLDAILVFTGVLHLRVRLVLHADLQGAVQTLGAGGPPRCQAQNARCAGSASRRRCVRILDAHHLRLD